MSSTVTVRLSGGLGNQLFQYAAARALALRKGTKLVLDIRPLEKSRSRSFMLAPFAHAGHIADRTTLPPSGGPRLWWWRRAGGRNVRIHRERGFGFDPAAQTLAGDIYLHGYFQNENYFADVAADIRNDLRLSGGLGTRALEAERQIQASPAVSLHIRRGDYVSSPKAARTHGVLSLNYYRQAVERISARMDEAPVVFVFTDDPEWASDNLSLPCATVAVSGGGITDQEELTLMSRCRHHVIANSSFSWWGAWLNPSPDKIVIAPDPWFADPARREDSPAPGSWHRLPSGL